MSLPTFTVKSEAMIINPSYVDHILSPSKTISGSLCGIGTIEVKLALCGAENKSSNGIIAH